MSSSKLQPGTLTITRPADELAVDLATDRLRSQFDWNNGLNQRAGTLIALNGLVLTLSSEPVSENEVYRLVGQLLLILSIALLLWCFRTRSESVWGGANGFRRFAEGIAGRDEDSAREAILERLLSGTDRNERVLGAKSREIEIATMLTFIGLAVTALGGFTWDGTIKFLITVSLVTFVLLLNLRNWSVRHRPSHTFGDKIKGKLQ